MPKHYSVSGVECATAAMALAVSRAENHGWKVCLGGTHYLHMRLEKRIRKPWYFIRVEFDGRMMK